MLLEHCMKHYHGHWKKIGKEGHVSYYTSLDFDTEDGDLILIYDADYFIIQQEEQIDNLLRDVMCIGFQEKLAVPLSEDIQRQMFYYLHFKTYTFEPQCVE